MEWGLLDELQQFVGALAVHAFRKPDDADLIASLAGLQRKLAHQLVALAGSDDGLLVLSPDGCQPLVHGEIWPLHDELVPLACEVIADGLMISAHGGELDGGVGEVEVGMLEASDHGIVLSQELAGEGNGYG